MTSRGIPPALITLLLLGTGVVGAQSPASASEAGDDRRRCASGAIDACVRAETAGCDAGDAKACRSLTGRYINSIGVPLDRVRADQLMARTFRLADSACTSGDLGGCAIAGVAYGTGQGAPLDIARAHGLEERACGGGDADGCYAVGYASLAGTLGFERGVRVSLIGRGATRPFRCDIALDAGRRSRTEARAECARNVEHPDRGRRGRRRNASGR